jgi:formamidopyrimidine-DNA glycosylase
MPELPEIETIRRGIEPFLINQSIDFLIIREKRLRVVIDETLLHVCQQKIENVSRRGKYLLLQMPQGSLLIHLGMSGRLHLLEKNTEVKKHDHVDFILQNQQILRYSDPRRFGLLVWVNKKELLDHKLLKHLGPEPLTDSFAADSLYQKLQRSSRSIKLLIMDNRIVVGVGNIYANEALFKAAIHPQTPGNKIPFKKVVQLITAIQSVLSDAIDQGGTTFKDFQDAAGKPGYFQQKLSVYGRENLPCITCHEKLISIRLDNRATVFCSKCQKF